MIKAVDTLASAWDIVTPIAIRNSWKKLRPLPSSSMQISEVFEENTNNEYVQQFPALNITYTCLTHLLELQKMFIVVEG